MAQQITDKDFEEEVLKSNLPVLVDFWAPWCGPCKTVAPAIDQIAEEYGGRLKVCKLNVDTNPLAPARFGIMSIPTLIIFKNSKVVKQIIGAVSKSELKLNIEDCLNE